MKTQIITFLAILFISIQLVHAGNEQQAFNTLSKLKGNWTLAVAELQEGKATQSKLVAPLVGTDKTAMSFKVIGKGSAVQENLLPGTGKEMATMYHCKDNKNCDQVVAKHYCAKQNQPEYVVGQFSNNSVTFTCDMNEPTCQSKSGHVHEIQHELSNDGNNLKTTYVIFKDNKMKKASVYHFVRK
jgi:hypothetical protein